MTSRKARRADVLAASLATHRVLHIRQAAALLGVSAMTVRRDVAENPDQFAYLGGHIVPVANIEGDGPYELAKAADRHAAAKKSACRHALRYIQADESIFFDCGTTLVHLVDLIPENMPITAVCYALNIAERLSRKPNVTLVVLGGLYHASSGSLSGETGHETLARLGINTAFLTAAGLDSRRGATCANFHEAPIKMQAMDIAQRNVLVTDNSKIGQVRPAFFAKANAFDAIITEDGELDVAALEPSAQSWKGE